MPQLSGSVRVSTQKPVQPVVPAGQPQVPARQTVPPPQARPQPPQWPGSTSMFTQLAPQRVWPSGHALTQLPALHSWPSAHTVPQLPQLRGSLPVGTQTSAQRVWAAGQTQRPAWQTVPPKQALLQAPQ
jgi:hypothetical protein